MKSNVSKEQSSKIRGKWDFLLIVIGYLFIYIGIVFLGEITGYRIVLLLASVVSVGNAIYYGLILKDLKKLLRLGLSIFFFLISLAGFMLYILLPQADESLLLGFGHFVGILTFMFIYKHKTPRFWN
jgi:inner membrane protein involved in colicin E2 resistance